MKFVADECCDDPLVTGLRSDGHDVVYIREVAAGSDDKIVLQISADQERILLTEDKDFGELVVRLNLPTHGIVLLRMNPAESAAKLARLRFLLEAHGDQLANSFTVLDEVKVRFRRLRGV
jgi:predicted nuclease of predicted toxin-antitoxin system